MAYDVAIQAAPLYAPARLNKAIMLSELGSCVEARKEFADLAGIEAPTDNTLVAIAAMERSCGNLTAAAAALDSLLLRKPLDRVALSARAHIGAELGEISAPTRYRAALLIAPDDEELLLGYADAATAIDDLSDAVGRIERRLEEAPTWCRGHECLSAARWENGERSAFTKSYEASLALHPQNGVLWKGYVEALGRVDDFAAAATASARAASATGDQAFLASAFSYRSACGDVEGAEKLLSRLPAGLLSPLAVAKHRLRQHDPAGAEALLAEATASDDVEAWALRGVAWQMTGDERFEWLNLQEGFVGQYDLPLSSSDVAAIGSKLRSIHADSRERAGQSARGGGQTRGNLFDRTDPEFVLLRDILWQTVEAHRSRLPSADPTHPLLKHRNASLAFAGSWSIRLTDGGFHVQHIHQNGLLSAVCYWAIPRVSPTIAEAGWLHLGGSPYYLGLDLEPILRIKPALGRLILFPSTLHHGTCAFDAGERISVAFDVVVSQP